MIEFLGDRHSSKWGYRWPTLTGHYSSEALGDIHIAGTVTGRGIEFSFDADLQDQTFRVTYTGTLQEDGTLSGQIDLGGFGGGPFTGSRR